jgi:ATP-binding cassette subfamily B protein
MLLRLLRTHLRPYKKWLWAVVGLQLVQAICNLLLPTVNADIIDQGVIHQNNGYIWTHGGLMLGMTALQMVFAVGAVYCGAKAAMGFGRDVRASLFHQVTDFSAKEVNLFGPPSLITRVTNDVQQVQLLVVMTAVMAVSAPITMSVGIVMAVRQDVDLSMILVVAVPVAGVVLGSVVYRIIPAFQVMQERIDPINRVLREQITAIRVERAFVREPLEKERFSEANADLTVVALRAGRLMSAMFPLVNLIIGVSSVTVLWIGADRVASGDLQVGSLVAYLSYLVQVLFSVMMATFMVSMIPRASVSSERLQEVLDTDTSVVRPAAPVRELTAKGELRLDRVGFCYPGAEQPVLDDISFTTRPGRTTAIVGSTGAGKTTLVSLVPRLFDATEGSVIVGGVDVRELDPDVLWQTMGLVPQKPYLFTGTVASNLQYGKPDATEAEMWEALEVAQAADFVRAMPGGLEARIEQGGTNVSGGQRQRLSIARALVRKPDIYLFDDSFSALDLATDARLRAALVPYTRDAAVVIVAQRVSTISTADEIVVLDDGRMVGIGTHDELLAGCPTYAEIVESQIGAEDAA